MAPQRKYFDFTQQLNGNFILDVSWVEIGFFSAQLHHSRKTGRLKWFYFFKYFVSDFGFPR